PVGAGVGVDRGELPVGAAAARVALEAEEWQRTGQREERGQMLVGLLLPARAPHQLEPLSQPAQQLAGAGREEMDDAVDRAELPGRAGAVVEAEQRNDPVDIDQQQRSGRFGCDVWTFVGYLPVALLKPGARAAEETCEAAQDDFPTRPALATHMTSLLGILLALACAL